MLWIIYCKDAENIAELRAEYGQEHGQYLRSGKMKILLAGPLLALAGINSIGSFFLMESETYEDIHTFVYEDPFSVSGIWKSIEIHSFKRSDASLIKL